MPLHHISFEDLRAEHAIIKRQMPNTIVLVRIGDCYETFDDDAETVAHDLKRPCIWQEIESGAPVRTLTLPARSINDHIVRLLVRGHTVATATLQEVQS